MAFRGRLPKIVVNASLPDSTRIKGDMAATENRMQWGAPNAKEQLQKYSAQADTLKQLRNGAPPGTHKSFAEGVDAFDGRAITKEGSPKPPTASIPRGTAPAVSLPSATGRPAGIQLHDGTDNARANHQVLDADDNTSPSTGPRKGSFLPRGASDSAGRVTPGVQSFNAAEV